jgi:hypothetical protein
MLSGGLYPHSTFCDVMIRIVSGTRRGLCKILDEKRRGLDIAVFGYDAMKTLINQLLIAVSLYWFKSLISLDICLK